VCVCVCMCVCVCVRVHVHVHACVHVCVTWPFTQPYESSTNSIAVRMAHAQCTCARMGWGLCCGCGSACVADLRSLAFQEECFACCVPYLAACLTSSLIFFACVLLACFGNRWCPHVLLMLAPRRWCSRVIFTVAAHVPQALLMGESANGCMRCARIGCACSLLMGTALHTCFCAPPPVVHMQARPATS